VKRLYDGLLYDLDVHHAWDSPQELAPYLSAEWRDHVLGNGRPTLRLQPPGLLWPHPQGTGRRAETYPDGYKRPGSSYELLCEQHLDPLGVERVVLGFDIGMNGALPNPLLAAEVVRAANDWSIAEWLERDPRLYGGLLVAPQVPELAAAEVRRIGSHPKVCQVLFAAHVAGRPFGHPIYNPIYEAAVEVGLPIAFHSAGISAGGLGQPAAGGMPGSRLEYHTLAPQATMHDLASMITFGVFERFPELRLLIVETGVGWVPWLLWKLDRHYDALRRESPWVKRLPSDSFRDHVHLTTQPLDESEEVEQLVDVLESFGGMEHVLCFSSDYPHWDTDTLRSVARRLPRAWWDDVFHGNAARHYGWPVAAPAPVA
jgi:uncharacterized protein